MGTARSSALALLVVGASVLSACGSDGKTASDTTLEAVTTVLPDTTVEAPVTTAAAPVFTGEAAAVEKAFRARVDAYNAADGEGFVATFSAARKAAYGDRVAEVAAGVAAGTFELRLFALRGITVSDDGGKATVKYDDAFVARGTPADDVAVLVASTETWVKEQGAWKLDQVGTAPPEVPAGVAIVDVAVADAVAVRLPPAVPSGPFAFRLTNTGAESHAVLLLRLTQEVDVTAYLAKLTAEGTTGPGPEGVEVGAIQTIDPGNSTTVVFSGPLPAGKYLLLCAARDDAGTSHMLVEHAAFTVR